MVLRPVSDPRVVTRDGAALFGIDANWGLCSVRLCLWFRNQEQSLTSRQEARERRIVTTVKPFAGTLRVTNPARKSRASSRKRVLH